MFTILEFVYFWLNALAYFVQYLGIIITGDTGVNTVFVSAHCDKGNLG